MRGRFLIGFVLAACARPRPTPPAIDPPPPTPARTPAQPIAAWFGTFDAETGTRERRTLIPMVEGQSFGWRIKTRCTGPVRFRAALRRPGQTEPATTVDYAACKQGWVEHQWTVAEGDAAGTYVITVELDGYATQTFRPRFVAGE